MNNGHPDSEVSLILTLLTFYREMVITSVGHIDGVIGEIGDEILEGVEALLHDGIIVAKTLLQIRQRHVVTNYAF